MALNPAGQQGVIQAAYACSAVDMADISYIEAHGTGTPSGDLVEARSLQRTSGTLQDGQARSIGAVKPNVGHMLAAAGIASRVKLMLMLHHRQIPPALNCERPRKRLKFNDVGLHLNQARLPWPEDRPLLAG